MTAKSAVSKIATKKRKKEKSGVSKIATKKKEKGGKKKERK